ncbi:MAG: PhnD/SsuA/transferrin family substrate-binding protein [Nitrospirae bacterium]|nr:PhnD/SsuA/transferrin family substrate-binding protein [Nitrospirota bacterium]
MTLFRAIHVRLLVIIALFFMAPSIHATEGQLKIGLGSRITPGENIKVYRDLVSYLSKKTGWKIDLVQTTSYAAMNKSLETGKVDVAFICTGAFQKGLAQGWAEALAVPVFKGGPVYFAYLIARPDIRATDLIDLQGRSFAFTDQLSLTGFILPEELLRGKGFTHKTFFSKTLFTRSHDRSIMAVARGLADAASVDGVVFDAYMKGRPELRSRLSLVKKYGPFPAPPLAASKTTDREIKGVIQRLFLDMGGDREGRAILEELGVESFEAPAKDLYRKKLR